jgi:diguanylate cyclase (GGDEF)-like protein
MSKALQRKLTEADLRLMAALGENISIAIGRARLYTEIRESEERYRSLFQNASMGIFHSLPEGRFIQVNPALAKMFGYASPEEIVREHGFSERAGCEKLKSLRLPVARTPHLREIVDTARPVIVPDTVAVPEWRKEECAVWARSYAGIPIQYMGMVVGFINIYSATAGFFTQAHTERMQTFANQIATVFANSRLVESLQKANERLNAQLSEIQALEAELREQAIRDPLTRLFNRRYLQVTLVREIARVNRTSQPVGIMIMDIDRFKLINDAYGHEAGDHFLHALGELRKNNTRREDIACRSGGEEFVVVMPGAALQIAQERAEILRSRIEALRVPHENWNIHATVSLGVAAYPQHGVTSEDVLIRADRALYHAKQEGRNRVVVYTDTIQMTFS